MLINDAFRSQVTAHAAEGGIYLQMWPRSVSQGAPAGTHREFSSLLKWVFVLRYCLGNLAQRNANRYF